MKSVTGRTVKRPLVECYLELLGRHGVYSAVVDPESAAGLIGFMVLDDLDLLVYDENDHLVCRSTGSSDREYCRWWPRWTGPFRIEIQNLGTVANLYRVATN